MKNYLIVFLLFVCFTLHSQETPPQKQQFNVHKYEIGLDFQHIFRDYSVLGTSLVFKKRIGEKQFVSLNEKKAWRIQLGIIGNSPGHNFNRYEVEGLRYGDLYDYSVSRFNVSVATGIEWQKQKGRVQYFYGFDVWGRLGKSRELGNTYAFDSLFITDYNLDLERGFSIGTTGFGGIKFFLSPEFSLSIESGLHFGYHRSTFTVDRVDIVDRTSVTRVEQQRNTFIYGFDYLRNLNLSYYF